MDKAEQNGEKCAGYLIARGEGAVGIRIGEIYGVETSFQVDHDYAVSNENYPDGSQVLTATDDLTTKR